MKKIYLGLLVSLLSTASLAQDAYFEWARSAGGTSDDYGKSITTDAFGNVYVTGWYYGTADFDPGVAIFNLTSNGGDMDVFIQKLDSSGNFIWAKSVGGPSWDQALSIDTDPLGNVYVTGRYFGTSDFDPGVDTFDLTSNGAYDGFILKLDASGNFIWARSVGGTSSAQCTSITTDSSGNVYVTGAYSGTADFDPDTTTTFNLISSGLGDVFILKLDSLGSFVWAKSMGGTSGDYAQSISTDALGNVYVAGQFEGTGDYDPGVDTFNLISNGNVDGLILKLDALGNFVWAKSIGGTLWDIAASITNDNSGNVYVTGFYFDTVDFDLGVDTFNLASNGIADVYILRLDASGNFIWAKSTGGMDLDESYGITTDASGNVYVTGAYIDTVDFDPNASIVNLTANGNRDIFIQKLDAGGNFVWAKSMGGEDPDYGYAITIDSWNNVYITGVYKDTADFDPNVGTSNLISDSGSFDLFIQKFSQCTQNTGTDVITTCDSITWIDAVNYTASNNTATYTLTNAGGCDSVVTLNLTISSSNTGVDVITACDSITWMDGITYTADNNVATHTLNNVSGCDSVVTLNLTISSSSTGVDVITTCDSITWMDGITYTADNNAATHTLTNAVGCDSVVTLNLIVKNSGTGEDVISACDSFTWIDGNMYNASNSTATYSMAGGAANGCDSVSTLILTINPSPTVSFSGLDTSYCSTDAGVTMTGSPTGGTFSGTGGTAGNEFYPATGVNTYTVTYSYTDSFGCSNSTSQTVSVVQCAPIVSVEEHVLQDVKIYPNPTTGLIMLTNLPEESTRITVYSALGALVHNGELNGSHELEIDLSALPSGLYLLQLTHSDVMLTKKVVKR